MWCDPSQALRMWCDPSQALQSCSAYVCGMQGKKHQSDEEKSHLKIICKSLRLNRFI